MNVLLLGFLAFLHFSLAGESSACDEDREESSGGLCFDEHVSLSAEQIDENERRRLGDEYIRPARRLNPYVPPKEEEEDYFIFTTSEEESLRIDVSRNKRPLVHYNKVEVSEEEEEQSDESNPMMLMDLDEDADVQRARRNKMIFYVTLLCILFGIIAPILTYYIQLSLNA